MAIIPVKGIYPQIDPSVWVADNATITGDVEVGADSSIWFQVVIRGDVNKIKIGSRVNVQDASIIHGTTGQQDTIIGNDVSIGHRAKIKPLEQGKVDVYIKGTAAGYVEYSKYYK